MSNVNRRCGCRGTDGKQLGKACPKLRNPRHGSWGYRLSAGTDPATGRRRWVSGAGYPTAADARTAADMERRRLRSGTHSFDRSTVAEYLTAWVEGRARHDTLRASTLRTYRAHISNDLIPAFGALRLSALNRRHVAALIGQLQDAGRGAVTVRRIHATLSSALADAVQDGLIDANPAAGARLPKAAKRRVLVWDRASVDRFRAAAAGHRLNVLFDLAIVTGLRRGEICGLTWADVNLDAGHLTVRRQLVQVGSAVVEGPVKTAAGQDRTVALPPALVAALRSWRDLQALERIEHGPAYRDTGRVFTMRDGRALRPAYPSRVLDTIVKRLGLPRLTFHGLRHLFASIQLDAGTPMGDVSKLMGHSTLALTVDLYSHLMATSSQRAAIAAGAWLTGPADTAHTV